MYVIRRMTVLHISISVMLEAIDCLFSIEYVVQLNKIDEELKRILSVKMDILKQLQVNKLFNVHIPSWYLYYDTGTM